MFQKKGTNYPRVTAVHSVSQVTLSARSQRLVKKTGLTHLGQTKKVKFGTPNSDHSRPILSLDGHFWPLLKYKCTVIDGEKNLTAAEETQVGQSYSQNTHKIKNVSSKVHRHMSRS